MSIDSVLHRWGMGPKVDPHFDAHVGRLAATSRGGVDQGERVAGYVELDGDRPWMVLHALLAVIHGESPSVGLLAEASGLDRLRAQIGAPKTPQRWKHIREIRYLTTDPGCGIALPMHDFMPAPSAGHAAGESRASLLRAISRLNAATNGRLRGARWIGLTVTFELGETARDLASVFGSGIRDRTRAHVEAKVQKVLFGGTRWVPKLLGVPSLQAQKLGLTGSFRPQLAQTMRRLHHPPLPDAAPLDYGFPETGRNTIVGIVDFGCDFAHPSFRCGLQGTQSRILALWDQNAAAGPSPAVDAGGENLQFGYGRLFTRQDIEAALAQWQATDPGDPDAPYNLLGYDPHQNHYTAQAPGARGGPLGAHGTFVMEAAAGCLRSVGVAAGASPPRGVASGADIVFVQVRQHLSADGRRVLNISDVVDAVAFVFHTAEQNQRPCVVNLSLNTMSGPHDGDGFFERTLSSLMRSGSAGPDARGRAVVIAAGNLPDSAVQTMRWQHVTDDVIPGAGTSFLWCVAAHDATHNTVEVWYDATDALLQVTLKAPNGVTYGPVMPGAAMELMQGDQLRIPAIVTGDSGLNVTGDSGPS